MNEDKEKPIEFKLVWVLAWIFTANSSTTLQSDMATIYADKCLKDYQSRFETKTP